MAEEDVVYSKLNGEFLANMEDVLEVYQSDPLPGVRRICMDERSCQLTGEVYSPIPMKPGSAKKLDNEYKREGTCAAFLAYDIDSGERFVWLNRTRTKKDYATFMNWISRKKRYQQAEKIIVVQDNLNTHTYGSFYEHLPTERASELRKKFEFHYTPKHGSCLNMAEIEFAVLSRQCLNRRIAGIEEMDKEIQAWQFKRNRNKVKISWSFTVDEARKTMQRHYVFD